MASTQQKRQREEEAAEVTIPVEFDEPSSKRQNSYYSILSILDDEQENDNPNQDLSAIFTTLEQELSTTTTTSTSATFDFDYLPSTTAVEDQSSTGCGIGGGGANGDVEEVEEDCVRVMKHLLEASDDELGIPNKVEEEINSGENPQPFGFSGGLWELEDETANYYTILQSELFM